jgi:hypothetical protein
MEAAQSSESIQPPHYMAQQPETHKFYFHCHENLKYHKWQYEANEILDR